MLILTNHLHFARSDLLTKFLETFEEFCDVRFLTKFQEKSVEFCDFLSNPPTFLLLQSSCYICAWHHIESLKVQLNPTALLCTVLSQHTLQFHTYITYCTVQWYHTSTIVIDIILNCTAMNIHYTTQWHHIESLKV